MDLLKTEVLTPLLSVSTEGIELHTIPKISKPDIIENSGKEKSFILMSDGIENTEEIVQDTRRQSSELLKEIENRHISPIASKSEGEQSNLNGRKISQSEEGFKQSLSSYIFDVALPRIDLYNDLSSVIPW
jgi:hypothetical protein